MSHPTINARVERASSLFNVSQSEISGFLLDIGVENSDEGFKLLESEVASDDILYNELSSKFPDKPILKRKATVAILKGKDPYKNDPPKKTPPVVDMEKIAEALKPHRNVSQLKDRELIEMYDKERDEQIEVELNKRAKGQRFVVLKKEKYEPGKEAVDIEETTELLKRSRRMVNPSFIPGSDGKVVPVYRITDLNVEDRIVEICPMCGEVLYKGYCEKCQLNFSSVEDDERAYINLIAHCESFNNKSYSDRKAVYASAIKGLEDLKVTWPSIWPTFQELKNVGNLPKLRMLKNMPSQVLDPFHASGNRSY